MSSARLWLPAILGVALTVGCSVPFGEPAQTLETSPGLTSGAVKVSSSATPQHAAYEPVTPPQAIDGRVGSEVSGVVASTATPNVFFTVDDATGTKELGVVRADGSFVGRLSVEGMLLDNAEALTSGPCGKGSQRPCLFVGDLGDHYGRPSVTVHRVREPDVSKLPDQPVGSSAWTYTYPDGPQDAEALLVDRDASVLVVAKRAAGTQQDGVARVYRGAAGGGKLRLIASVRLPRPPRPAQSLFVGNVVTDAAWEPGRVVLLTYDQVIEFVGPTADAELGSFAGWSRRQTSVTGLRQAEAITLRQPCGFVVAGEGGEAGAAQIASAGCETTAAAG